MTALPKPKREKDSDYLEYIRKQPCLVRLCQELSSVDAHHVITKGQGKVGSKVDDRLTVPLCRYHHEIYHRFGMDEFESRYGLILSYEIVKLTREYRPPVKKRKREKQPQVLRIEVYCQCKRTHKLTPGKFNGGSWNCPVLRQRVTVA